MVAAPVLAYLPTARPTAMRLVGGTLDRTTLCAGDWQHPAQPLQGAECSSVGPPVLLCPASLPLISPANQPLPIHPSIHASSPPAHVPTSLSLLPSVCPSLHPPLIHPSLQPSVCPSLHHSLTPPILLAMNLTLTQLSHSNLFPLLQTHAPITSKICPFKACRSSQALFSPNTDPKGLPSAGTNFV